MNNLFNLEPKVIADFLLNNKKGDCFELAIDSGTPLITSSTRTGPDGREFKNISIYKDKHIEIIYSYLIIAEDDVIEEFLIYSKWWGKIKNSIFTLGGDRGEFKNIKCGVINLNELKDWNSGSNHAIHNKNQKVEIEITDFASLTAYCQRLFRGSPSYGQVKVLREAPNSWVSVEIHMPDGIIHIAKGTSKKEAGKTFAKEFAEKLKVATAS